MSTSGNFTISFATPESGPSGVDVNDLTPALVALTEIFEQANAGLNRDSANVSLNATSFSAGSLEIDFVLAISVVEMSGAFQFINHAITNAPYLKDLIFGKEGFIEIKKRLKGENPEIIEDQGGDFVLKAKELNMRMPEGMSILLKNDGVNKSTRQFTQTVEKDSIESISVLDNGKELTIIEKGDSDYFGLPNLDKKKRTAVATKELSIVTLAFASGLVWRLKEGENKQASYHMNDEEFMFLVEHGQERFGKGDILKCLVKTTHQTIIDDTEISEEVTKREIVKVHDHQIQGELPI